MICRPIVLDFIQHSKLSTSSFIAFGAFCEKYVAVSCAYKCDEWLELNYAHIHRNWRSQVSFTK